MRTGEPVTPAIRENLPLFVASFSPDGETFVVAGGQQGGTAGGARLRKTRDGSAAMDLLTHDSMVRDAQFSPDGQRLVTVAEGGTSNVKLWDTRTGRLLWTGRHPDGVAVSRWSPEGSTIYTGGFDQRVRTWSASSGTPAHLVLKTLGSLSSLDLTRDGTKVIAGTSGGDVRLREVTGVVQRMSHKGFIYVSRFSPDGSLALTSAGDRTARLWDARTGEPLTPGLSSGAISRSATFLADGESWAWTGVGIFVDQIGPEDRSATELRDVVESAAARALTQSGTQMALMPEEVEARFARRRGASAAAPPPPADYYRTEGLAAWKRLDYADALRATETLRARYSLNWLDVMRLAGAYAATGRWQDALVEIRRHRARWTVAPELFYMEAVALARSTDRSKLEDLCRAVLNATHGSRHPERAYWAARTCVLRPTVNLENRDEIYQRVQYGYDRVIGNLGREELQAALLLRSGRSLEAFSALASAAPTSSTPRAAALLTALAAARAGRRVDALKWQATADGMPHTPTHIKCGRGSKPRRTSYARN